MWPVEEFEKGRTVEGERRKGEGRERLSEGNASIFLLFFCLFELSLFYWLQVGGVEWYMPRKGVRISSLYISPIQNDTNSKLLTTHHLPARGARSNRRLIQSKQ